MEPVGKRKHTTNTHTHSHTHGVHDINLGRQLITAALGIVVRVIWKTLVMPLREHKMHRVMVVCVVCVLCYGCVRVAVEFFIY